MEGPWVSCVSHDDFAVAPDMVGHVPCVDDHRVDPFLMFHLD